MIAAFLIWIIPICITLTITYIGKKKNFLDRDDREFLFKVGFVPIFNIINLVAMSIYFLLESKMRGWYYKFKNYFV